MKKPPAANQGGLFSTDLVPKGYAGIPGKGPPLTTCKDCRHFKIYTVAAGALFSCSLAEQKRPGGIRMGMRSCDRFTTA